MKMLKMFVLKLACRVNSEVDGSQRSTAACQVPHKPPFWRSWLLLIPSSEAEVQTSSALVGHSVNESPSGTHRNGENQFRPLQ